MSPRADAVRNRAKVLSAADEVFVEHGTDASTDQIAKRAGVGIGTVFRHFPTKELLLEAVFAERLRRVGEQARTMATRQAPDEAFRELFGTLVADSGAKQALAEALTEAGVDVRESASPVEDELRAALGELLARAQQAGGIRDDIGIDEVIALLVGASQAIGKTLDVSMRARTLNVFLDGMRPH
ncbi:TetR/AcrR family transcriptional regulator [Prauserella muralis]|uniref:Uncharacterized protein n=1 Tax=Prauserella muralis TaxID=588067 RepID=A0A2V4B783_9PSEU|nr:TetR/AcrR family transcriptional regulator [Prauserella muralis]PXY31006.1 hypothetical protein BAY60_00830 [Prauserella muralis]TWE14728.1 TetR family transcriptional regulator [Prauserella muralis]